MGSRSDTMVRVVQHARSPSRPLTRPKPDARRPPNGADCIRKASP